MEAAVRVRSKGQVSIPRHIREKLGTAPNSEVPVTRTRGRFGFSCRPF
ncbi:MAG: AbrB/MazE/SpoVT family DNA-binding domain-containing protein [Deltaproteobacteria bacterium]|nr:AbrB/MazE/SpoVT family DNA-binding domain-containing protein [Deltaproteobacteria bacterium]